MDERSSKEKILKKVRKSLLAKSDPYQSNLDWDTDVYREETGELVETFSGNFLNNQGSFTYCFNGYDFLDQYLALAEEKKWNNAICLESHLCSLFETCDYELFRKAGDVQRADVGITGCDALISRTGSVIISSEGNLSRTVSIFPSAHVVIAFRDQLLYDLNHYFRQINLTDLTAMPSMMSIISGPSRTADIEKTLVLGAHGPKEIYVFYIDQHKPL